MELSVVSPVYNEEKNIQPLYEELKEVLEKTGKTYEIILVDDGSTDNSYQEMNEIAQKDEHFKAIKLRRNFGQSSALQAAFDNAQGEIVISIDADLQNDPKDIPKLIEKLEEGYDCVSGWRHEREDPLSKKIFSGIASRLRQFFLGTNLHDYGCTLKAYTQECLEEIKITGEMHRYIPPLLRWRGFNVEEIKVNHRKRKSGETNYGPVRIFRGFMDMINVWFWQKFHGRPLHLFGGIGILSVFIGIISGSISIYWKIFKGLTFTSTPIPLFSVFMFSLGVLLFVFGLMSDVLLKNYYSVEEKKVYSIKEITD